MKKTILFILIGMLLISGCGEEEPIKEETQEEKEIIDIAKGYVRERKQDIDCYISDVKTLSISDAGGVYIVQFKYGGIVCTNKIEEIPCSLVYMNKTSKEPMLSIKDSCSRGTQLEEIIKELVDINEVTFIKIFSIET